MALPDNPWAYPTAEWTRDGEHVREHNGMTLRDYFAGQALAGILAGPCSREGAALSEWADIPIHAYKLADIMLKERAK